MKFVLKLENIHLFLLPFYFYFYLFFALCADAQSKPNILILAIDDLRPELACYGASHIHSPNVDRLAATSMQFDQAYAQQAVCLPSRISLFTGMRPNSTGVHDLQTKFRDTIPQVVTLPQHFSNNGYKTIGMGKVYHDEQWNEWSEWIDVKKYAPLSTYHSKENRELQKKLISEAKQKGLKGRPYRRYVSGPAYEGSSAAPERNYHDGAMTDLAIKALKEADDQPFFMVVGYKKPHLPFVAPKKYWDLYDPDKIELPDNYYPSKEAPSVAQMTWGELRAYSGIPAKGPVDSLTARRLIHGYYAGVSFVDALIGRLLEALKEQGLDDNTIVVLWGDHGWKLGEHAMWCKHTNYEIDARVPLIIKAPNDRYSSGRSSALVELVDLYPTLCELAGLDTPSDCEGTSLVSLIKNPAAEWTEYAYSQYPRRGTIMGYSIKSKECRYTEWINEISGAMVAREYYDHVKDPNENKNVVKEASYFSNINRLSALLNKQRKQ